MRQKQQKTRQTYDLQESEICAEDVVESDVRREPRVVEMLKRQAVGHVADDAAVNHLATAVDAAAEFTAEKADAHDAEEQPEDEADEQHVEDGRDRLDQRVHHHLPQPQSMRVISCNLPKIVIQQLSQVIWQTCIVVPLPKGHLDPPIWAQTSLSPKPAHDLLAALHNTSYAQHTDDAICDIGSKRPHLTMRTDGTGDVV